MNELQQELLTFVKAELQEHFKTWHSSWIVDYLSPMLHGRLTREQIQAVVDAAYK